MGCRDWFWDGWCVGGWRWFLGLCVWCLKVRCLGVRGGDERE